MRTFFFQTKNKSGLGTLFVRVRRRVPALQIKISTRIQVDIASWEKAVSGTKEWSRFVKTKDGKVINEKLQAIDAAIDNLIGQGIYDKVALDEAVANIVFAEEREKQKRKEEAERMLREKKAKIQAELEAARRADVLRFLENYVASMKDGTIKYKGANYTKNTVKCWNNFLGILTKFYKNNPFTWNDINKSLTDRFLCFMETEGYMVSAINKYLVTFRAMVGYAMEQGLHDNANALKAFTKRKIVESDKAKEIYLTAGEIQSLFEMKLQGLDAIVRDVFLVGCYTCQRFSDYSRLERENFTTTANGTKIVRLIQIKTRNAVVIPILNDNLLTIAERYNYDIPAVNDVVLNRYIKQILKELSQTVPTLAKKERTLLTMKERTKEERGEVTFERDSKGNVVKPRYELVSSHTARRSGITNLYLTGKFDTFQMMSISGHRDMKTFTEYIKLSSDEIADGIALKMTSEIDGPSNERLF
jgi:integrase